jgi:hypothetical protein
MVINFVQIKQITDYACVAIASVVYIMVPVYCYCQYGYFNFDLQPVSHFFDTKTSINQFLQFADQVTRS